MVEDESEEVAEDVAEDDDGEYLTADGALVHAANTLMLATEKAEYANDTPALMKIAGGWMEIHEYLAGVGHHEPRKQPLGFAPAPPKELKEEEEEELDDAIAATEGYRKRGLHAEYGKLRKSKGGYFRRG